jgi:hypothetical protein
MVLPVLGVAVQVAAIAFAGDDLQAERGPHGVRQREAAVAPDLQVGVQLLLAQLVEAGARHSAGACTQHPFEEALKEAHERPSCREGEHGSGLTSDCAGRTRR